MEKENPTESEIANYNDFMEVYPLFNRSELMELLTQQQVHLDFNTQYLAKHNIISNLALNQIFSYTQENGRVLKIQITNLKLATDSNHLKGALKGKVTFTVIK